MQFHLAPAEQVQQVLDRSKRPLGGCEGSWVLTAEFFYGNLVMQLLMT